jgi:hypothetical protein
MPRWGKFSPIILAVVAIHTIYRSSQYQFHDAFSFLNPVMIMTMTTKSQTDGLAGSNDIDFSTAHVNNNTAFSPPSPRRRLVIDVMSIASKERPEYSATQAETWASHSTVRHFWTVTEDDDANHPIGGNCSATLNTSAKIQQYVTACREKHSSGFLEQYRFFPARWVLRKSNPAGWLCAQIRVGTALAKLARKYLLAAASTLPPTSIRDQLPDFALLVDDDTMFQMNLLEEHMQDFSTADPLIWAGCLNILPRGKEIDRFSPFGGAGTVWSKSALERLLQPIYCHPDNEDEDNNNNKSTSPPFVLNVCERIQENLILERELFEEGMYMFEFIERVYYQNPNCFHSDWLLGHFIHYYYLSEPIMPNVSDGVEKEQNPWWDLAGQGRLLPLHDPDSVGVFYNESLPDGQLCSHTNKKSQTNETCHKDSLVCHYVHPNRMRQVTNEWMQH